MTLLLKIFLQISLNFFIWYSKLIMKSLFSATTPHKPPSYELLQLYHSVFIWQTPSTKLVPGHKWKVIKNSKCWEPGSFGSFKICKTYRILIAALYSCSDSRISQAKTKRHGIQTSFQERMFIDLGRELPQGRRFSREYEQKSRNVRMYIVLFYLSHLYRSHLSGLYEHLSG